MNQRVRKNRLLYLILFLLVSTKVCAELPKPEVKLDKPVLRVLFVGNSFSYYNNGVQNHLNSLVKAAGLREKGKTRFRLSTLSGGGLYEQQISHLLKPQNRAWDMVVVQGHSQEPINQHAAAFASNAKRLTNDIRESGAKAALFMTWGYENQPEMGEALARAYIELANQLDVLVVPVGLAFSAAEKNYPDIRLFVPDIKAIDPLGKTTFLKSDKHPSKAGTYLAACVFFSTFYQRSTEGLPYHAGMDPKQANKLQKAAWDVVQNFYQ